jgi:[acyl-carrier-protein] S-malonyltransferase
MKSLGAQIKKALIFPGQGSQFVWMGKDIYKEYVVARETLEECENALGERITTLMFEGPNSVLTETANAQPCILAHSIALLRVLESETDFKVYLF